MARTVAGWQRRGVTLEMLRGARYERVSRGCDRRAADLGNLAITPTQRIVDACTTLPSSRSVRPRLGLIEGRSLPLSQPA